MQTATYIHDPRPTMGQSNAYFLMRENLKLALAVHGNGTCGGLKRCLIFQR
jgi:hypothetical protein